MNILFLTWKDIRHPHAGGAEKVMYEYASGLVKRGHTVTWFASSYIGAPPEETIDGIRVIRRYTNHTIWMLAWWWYNSYKKENKIDIIIDEAGGWPLLSPLYEKKIPIYFCTTHIGDREFDAFPTPIGQLARYVYRSLFLVYRKTRTITISQSSKGELIQEFGFSKDMIDVVDMTTDIDPISSIDHSKKNHDLVFLGRLTSIKRPDHAVRAFHGVMSRLPGDTRLRIIGNAQDKKYVHSLKQLIHQLNIGDRVIFHGFLSKEELAYILSSSRCLLVPSEKEGYGLIVIEGNAYGLPTIGYDVAGLRDSIQPGVNGVLVGDGDYAMMGEEVVKLFANDAEYRTLCEKSLEHAKNIPTWDEQVGIFEGIITKTL